MFKLISLHMQCTVFLVNFTVGKKLLQSSYILSGKKRINCKVRPQYMRELTSFRTLMWRTLQFILHWFMKRIKRSYIKMYELCSIPNFECANFAVCTVFPSLPHTKTVFFKVVLGAFKSLGSENCYYIWNQRPQKWYIIVQFLTKLI